MIFKITIFMIIACFKVDSSAIQLDTKTISKSSEIRFFFIPEKPRFRQVMDIETHIIDEKKSGGIERETYKILCRNKVVVSEKYTRVNGIDFLDKRERRPFVDYCMLWQKVINLGALELGNIPFFDDIKSNEEFEKLYRGVGDFSTYEFSFSAEKKANTYRVRNITKLCDIRYQDILKEIRQFLNLKEDEGV